MPTLAGWLQEHGLDQYAEIFAQSEIDLDVMPDLTDQDLEKLGLPLGARKRFMRAIRSPSASSPAAIDSSPSSLTSSPIVSIAEGERRQLTVLFCDMVGFTELANRVDPEVLQRIIRSYEDACAVCITRYEGYVFQRLGDGIVAFFGYPLAHEGEAERAIRAGLEIIEALSKLDVPDAGHLAVRIGIATGLVVVSSAEKGAVGETMNLASRLQGIAQPGSIVVSQRVQRLAGGSFDYQDLGEQSLKGIARPTGAYRIVGVSEAASRFEAAHAEAGLTPLVGREQEIGLLMERWALAQDGEGQVVLLSGEPGIGKSRILSALRERLESQGAQALRFQCSPYYVNSAFWPSIDNFERALKFGRDEPPESKLDKLEALIVTHYGRPLADVRFIASMLSIPCDERYGAISMIPQKHKDETLRTLVDLTEAAARKQPSVMLYEDLHWADPTTLEVLDLLIDQARTIPLLVVLTHRPEFQSRWAQHGHVISLNLSKLTRAQSSAIVSKLAGGKALPAALLEQILTKTDGVPLFVEELTKSILESGDLKDAGDRYEYVGSAHSITIPATLRDSLMARLDRFAPVKEIAQIGAAIGREFSYELIAAVAPHTKTELDRALNQLTESGLAFRRGHPPEAQYTFKHALVQDAAYDSLLKTRRQTLHAKIARVLEEQFPATMDTEPEMLARHYTEASMLNLAIPYWIKAGQLALTRTALPEAISHLEMGQQLLERIPHTAERDGWELHIRSALGTAWWARKGWMAEEMVPVLKPALALAKALNRRDALIQVLWGLWVYYLIRGRVRESVSLVEQALAAARESNDADSMIVARMPAMVTYFWLGDLVTAKEHGHAIFADYDERRHWTVADHFNHDPKTLAGIYGQHWLWMLGFPDQALALARSKDEHARRRNHPFDLAFALTQGAHIYDYLADGKTLAAHGSEAQRIGEERGMPTFEIMGRAMQGVGLLREGDADQAIPVLREAMDRWRATGARLWGTYINAILGEALASSGKIEAGLEIVNRMLAQIDQPDWEERSHLAEILRLKGWVLSLKGDLEGAEKNYLASLDWARQQQAKSWELRTATSLAKLWQSQGKRKEAHELLTPIYGWFTEGFGTRDLKEAKAMLDELS